MSSLSSRLGMVAAGVSMTVANVCSAMPDHKLFIPAGTVIPMRLDRSLSSKDARPGDRVTATVKEGRDDAGLPPGTRIEGVVKEALPHEGDKPGVLDVDIRRLVIPGGQKVPVEASLYSLNGKDLKRRDGRLVATADKSKDRLKWVGIGAGAGILIGAITKGNTLFNTVLGAGAGYIYNELSNKKPGDVTLKEGAEFGIRLDKTVAVNVDDRTYERYQGRISDGRDDDRYYRRDDRGRDRDRDRTPIAERNGDIGVVVDDREVRFPSSAKPFMRGDIVMVPLEPISKAADFGYRYDSGDRIIRARNDSVRLTVGSRVAFVRGERRTLPMPAEIRDGMVYVPSQFLAFVTSGTSSWDSASRTIIVTTERDRDRED